MKTFTNQPDLTCHWESFRPYAYPDPMSPMYQSAPKAPWGFKSIDEIVRTYKLNPKLSCDPLTLGFGQARTLPGGTPITPDMTCTEEEAKTFLKNNLSRQYQRIYLLIGESALTLDASKINALCDYAYNLGENAFPKLIAKLKANDIPGASLEFLDGFTAKGKPLLGLLLRRISEYNTFLNGTYLAWEDGDPISQDLKDKLLAKNRNNLQAIKMINLIRVL